MKNDKKMFPELLHVGFEEEDGEPRGGFNVVWSDGVQSVEAGERIAIYKRVEVGTVVGPKSFVSDKKR